MKEVLLNLLLTFSAFAAMEGFAWLTHKYLMHGACWFLHHDHHHKPEPGFLEKNDFFFLIFALPGILCLLYGTYYNSLFFFIGIGITLYGTCYFFVHDIFIHQRFKFLRDSQHWYLKGIRRAHKMHHKHLTKEGGECFGMLWVPLKYFKENRC